MNYGEMLGRNSVRLNEEFIYVSDDANKRQAVKKNYAKSVVTDMPGFLRMEDMHLPIYVDEFLSGLNRMVNQLGAKIVHVPRNNKERSESVDFLGNRIYDEIMVQRSLYEKNKKESEENEKRQHQARMEKLKNYLMKNYPMYVDEQCKYVLTNSCGGYDEETLRQKVTEKGIYLNDYYKKSGFYSPPEREEKLRVLNSYVDELKAVSYNDILSNCIYNSVFMEEFLIDVEHIFLWRKVKTDISSNDISRLRRGWVKKVDSQGILLYKMVDFVRSGYIEAKARKPVVSINRKTDVVGKIKDALG